MNNFSRYENSFSPLFNHGCRDKQKKKLLLPTAVKVHFGPELNIFYVLCVFLFKNCETVLSLRECACFSMFTYYKFQKKIGVAKV